MIEDLHELGRLADVNLAGMWSALGRLSDASVGGTDGCPFMATGIPAAFFNGVYPTGPVDDPEQVVRDAIDFMAAHDVPWLMWVRSGIDDALLDAGRRAGLRDAGGPPAMALPAIPPTIPPAPDGLEIVVVADREHLEISHAVTSSGFDMPLEIAQTLVTEQTIADPHVVVVVGFLGGEPVSTALVGVTGTTAGIYNVATPPAHRRQGLGTALTWAAIERGAALGCDHAVLQASELGAPVYRAMGFVDVGSYVQLEGPPGPTTT